MAEPHALYEMRSKVDTYAARETCMDLSMAMYFLSSLAAVESLSTDGERLLVSAASEAVIEPGNVQCSPR